MSKLEDLAVEVKSCQKCPLYKKRIKAVPGEGNPDARLMFIGEAPGANEDQKGRPFCGAAGKFLDEMLASIDLKRRDVYIGNVVKCRPPANRDPEPEEIEKCLPYLKRQIEIIKPKVIVTLGRHSLGQFFPDRRISTDHGKAVRRGSQIYFFSYHPAAALYNGSMRKELINDFKRLNHLLGKTKKLLQKVQEA